MGRRMGTHDQEGRRPCIGVLANRSAQRITGLTQGALETAQVTHQSCLHQGGRGLEDLHPLDMLAGKLSPGTLMPRQFWLLVFAGQLWSSRLRSGRQWTCGGWLSGTKAHRACSMKTVKGFQCRWMEPCQLLLQAHSSNHHENQLRERRHHKQNEVN